MGRFFVLLLLVGCGFSNTVTGDNAGGGDGSVQPREWTKKRKLTIDNSGIPALANFPVAVILNNTRISYGSTKAMGADVRIGDASGKFYPHEIEVWDPAGVSIVWVRVPAIAGNAMTEMWLYYGNPNAADGQDAAAIWDANYIGVWHLGDARDSTGRLQSTQTGASVVPGRLGNAMQFTNAGQYVDTTSTEQVTRWTVELVMSPTTTAMNNGSQAVVSRFPNYVVLWSCSQQPFCSTTFFNSATSTHAAPYAATVGAWTYIVGRFDGNAVDAFVNGIGSGSVSTTATPLLTASSTAKIGSHPDTSGTYRGAVDEVRISKTARSTEYIRATARVLTDAYLTYGDEEPNN